jgi:hypothetical protein
MKTIKDFAETYSKSRVEKITAYTSFMDGVEFAQRWIPVEEELPILTEYGEWDGHRSDFVIAKNKYGEWHKARIYAGFMDGFEFCNWCDERDLELTGVVSWRPIECK